MIKLDSFINQFASDQLRLTHLHFSEDGIYDENVFINLALEGNVHSVLLVLNEVLVRSTFMLLILDSTIRQIEDVTNNLSIDNVDVARGLTTLLESILRDDVPNVHGIIAFLATFQSQQREPLSDKATSLISEMKSNFQIGHQIVQQSGEKAITIYETALEKVNSF